MRANPGTATRVARARFARNAALALLAVAAGILAAAWFLADKGLAWLDRRVHDANAQLVATLRSAHGLEFYAPLDERVPVELVTGAPLLGSSAVRVPGVFGSARRFDGRPGENLVAPLQRWSPFSRGGFTLAFWAIFPEDAGEAEQRLVWDCDETTGFGLRTVGGRLEAVFGDETGLHSLSAPAPAPGVPVHIAFALGTDRATLYVDDTACDSLPVAPPLTLHAHYVAFGTDGHFPPSFDVDEWGVWKRPLDAPEVARLAAANRPLPALLEPRLAAALHRREAAASFFRAVYGTVGALRTSLAAPAVLNQSMPVLELHFSGGDGRHFRAAHLEALASGFRTERGRRQRTVQASFQGRTERVSAWLDEKVPSLRLSTRPAFILAATNGLFGGESGLVRLFPPEQYGERRPDAARPLPLDPSSLVRLHLNGDFLGLYCLVPFETPFPAWFATGARDLTRPDRLHFSAPSSSPADGAGLSEGEREAAWRRMVSLLASDPGFPLRRPEARLLARRHDATRAALQLPDPAPGPEPLLGDNPAACYVTNDLDLAAAGPGIVWSSSAPDVISPEGRVVRPRDGTPRVVELAAALPDGTERPFRFRVMPDEPALPALFLSFGRPLDKLDRSDFSCRWIPAGKAPESSWAFGVGNSGAKLRGNTSYVTGRRRSIHLKFNEPATVPGVGVPLRHLLLLSGYADPTRLRNALSFDTFRAIAPDAPVRAVSVAWTEVFVNGAYAGVWEYCPRLPDVAAETFSSLYKVRAPNGLWLSAQASAEVVDRVDLDEETNTSADPYAPFRDLARFVAESDPATFADGAPERFDLDELVDFFLALNFTGNQDGRVTNQFAGQRADDGRWVLLPWDYDKTFLLPPAGAVADSRLLVSPLFKRLISEVPGFRERLVARWRELRNGPLSEETLDAWLSGRAALLAPFMDEDYRVVPPLGHDGTFADAVEILRAKVKIRLSLVDGFLSDLLASPDPSADLDTDPGSP